MPDPRLDAWADVLVRYSVNVQPGQTVAITGGVAGEPLIRAVYRRVVRAGGFPVVIPTFSGLLGDLLREGNDEQIAFVSPLQRFAYEQADVLIHIEAETNTRSLASVDPDRQVIRQRAHGPLIETYLKRSASGELRWVLTLYPTDAHAQDADMSTEEFAEFVFNAGKLHHPDPVASWQAQAAEQARLIEWLTGKRQIHLTGPDTDLKLDVTGRTWVNADGTSNFPDGEIFTSPVESSAEGTVRFTYPVSVAGREIADVWLRFERGRVVEARAGKGEDYLLRTLDADEGARFLGEFAIGTNFDITRFTRSILFDEKIGGTVHMAIGASIPEAGGVNRSAIHWDLICDLRQGGSLTVDGELFLKDGKIVV
ncbi:MAG TPA: aminopeptidase [Thermomicrobiales bacterium]